MNKIAFWSNLYPKINFKKDADVETQDNLCDSCFRTEFDRIISTDLGLQWGHGVVDPTFLSRSMCNECFKMDLDEPDFWQVGISELSCIQCGTDIEKNCDLMSAIKGVCNHCFLVVGNEDHSCIRCDPAFPIPEEAKNG